MLSTLTRLAPAPGICSLPSCDWPPSNRQKDHRHHARVRQGGCGDDGRQAYGESQAGRDEQGRH
eukprot:8366849-Pyramimonas_sp.AAC.1